MCIGTPVYDSNSEEIKYLCDWTYFRDISGMICITICVKGVRVFLIFSDFCIYCFEVTLVGGFVSFVNFLSWLYNGFMCMVHEVFHDIFERNKIRFCVCIHKATKAHCEILNIITILDSDVHESTNTVIYWYSMLFLIFFRSSPMRGVAMKSVFSKDVFTGHCDFWNLTSSFVFVPQYSWMIFSMMWSVLSILMPYLHWIMSMLRSFSFYTSWNV